jgi:phage repressor protein C with HTH and peptisase S24 domain
MLTMPHTAEKIPHSSSGFFPHDKISCGRDNPRSPTAVGEDGANTGIRMQPGGFEEVMARIERKLDQLGMTEREASLKAVGKPDLIRDMRRRSGLPTSERLAKLAALLGTSSDWLLYGGPEQAGEARVLTEVRGTGMTADDVHAAWKDPSPHKPVPLVGTAFGGEWQSDDGAGIEMTELHLAEVLDYLGRPPSLGTDRDAYAVEIVGDSMAPRFEPGERAFVSPRSPVRIGDDVIVQLRAGTVGVDGPPDQDAGADPEHADRVTMVLIKRLVKRTPAFLELRQFNPDMTFQVPTARVAAVHRVRGRL